MRWFGGNKERKRLEGLKLLEDKRLAFADEMKTRGIKFERALLVQSGGGFEGIAFAGTELYLLSGPAPGDAEGEFCAERITGAKVGFEPFEVPAEGGGGILGFGKKGGHGYQIVIESGGGQRRIQLVPALQCVMELREGRELALTSTQRRRKDANFVWDFVALSPGEIHGIVGRWKQMLG